MSETHVLTKAITIQARARSAAGGSRQLPVDPFGRLYADYGLVRPPYSLERLLELKEANALHAAAIDQKAADIAGLGWHWIGKARIKEPSQDQQDQLEEFLAECNPEMTFREILEAVWNDVETLGWGIIEVVTDGKGVPVELYHVPGHTVRAHRDGVRFAQIREGRLRWFKRFRTEGTFDIDTGEPRDGLSEERQAGNVIVIRRVGSRSSFYGIPTYISALGAIVGNLAVRDFNLNFFADRTIPDMLLVIQGADVSPEVRAELQAFFSSADVKGQHHKLLILPIPSDLQGVQARLEKLMPDLKDASFQLYRRDNALEILIAHRVPPYRIGWPIVGGLGGATAKEMTEIYKRSVVQPGQEILEHRLNNQLFRAFGNLDWRWKLDEIDLSDQMADLDYSIKGVQSGLLTPNEARAHLGRAPYPGGDTYYMPATLVAVGQAQVQKAAGNPPADWAKLHAQHEEALKEKVRDFFAYRRSAS